MEPIALDYASQIYRLLRERASLLLDNSSTVALRDITNTNSSHETKAKRSSIRSSIFKPLPSLPVELRNPVIQDSSQTDINTSNINIGQALDLLRDPNAQIDWQTRQKVNLYSFLSFFFNAYIFYFAFWVFFFF